MSASAQGIDSFSIVSAVISTVIGSVALLDLDRFLCCSAIALALVEVIVSPSKARSRAS